MATIDFEVADNLSGNIIISEIASSAVLHNEELSQKELARGEFELPIPGGFTFEQAFEVASRGQSRFRCNEFCGLETTLDISPPVFDMTLEA